MNKYHKIQTVLKRDPKTKFKTLIEGDFALPEFEYLKDNEWVFTEKVDGTNIRVIWNHEDKTFLLGGKTDRAEIPRFLLIQLQDIFFVQRFEQLFAETSFCLYGEGYGAKIQKGGGQYISDGVSFVLFDVKIDNWWLQRKDIEDIAFKLNIDVVPIIGRGKLKEMINTANIGFESYWGDFLAEGIVARPAIELKSRNGSRIITKIKHKDFR